MARERTGMHTLKFKCTHCGHVHDIKCHDGQQVKIGDVIRPYAGGGWWGKCRICRKPGLEALTECPKPKKGPTGWRDRSIKK
jgi:hypothetical protein